MSIYVNIYKFQFFIISNMIHDTEMGITYNPDKGAWTEWIC